jgi:hypothetical protein
MGYLLHRPIEIVSAIRTQKSNGYTNFRKSRVDWLDPTVTLTRHGQRWLWDYTTIALAGTLTQTFRYPDTPQGSALPDYRMGEKLSLPHAVAIWNAPLHTAVRRCTGLLTSRSAIGTGHWWMPWLLP